MRKLALIGALAVALSACSYNSGGTGADVSVNIQEQAQQRLNRFGYDGVDVRTLTSAQATAIAAIPMGTERRVGRQRVEAALAR